MEPNTLIALAAAGGVFCLGFLLLGSGSSKSDLRVKKLSGQESATSGFLAKIKAEDGGNRRKQIEETLGKIEERQKTKKKKAKALPARLIQADWSMKPQTFMVMSIIIAVIAGGLPFALGMKPLFCLGLGIGLGFGMPRFILNSAIARRQKKFTSHFADAMDIIVRGVRTGLPLGDCLKIIAHESPDPLGTEFRRVVEGESIGIPLEVCLSKCMNACQSPR